MLHHHIFPPPIATRLLGLLTAVCFALPAIAQTPQEQRVYIFGNSLVHHLSESPQTSVPYWLNQLAQQANKDFAVSGQWGLLRNFANDLPPKPNWTIESALPVWLPGNVSFAKAGINSVILTPANFIQYQSADSPYDGENPDNESPLKASLAVLDWVSENGSKPTAFVYEGWSDMGAHISDFPPSKREMEKYLTHNTAVYNDWYANYLEQLQAARPELNIQLIPVAQKLAGLLTDTPLSSIAVTDLFTDDAPHGTSTLYFLASLITYQTLFGETAPTNFVIPDTIDPLVHEHFPAVLSFITNGTTVKTVSVVKSATNPKQADEILSQPANPSLAMGLDGIADWSAQQPFVNIMKSARPWVGHIKGQWGGWQANDLAAAGVLDLNGWPMKVPAELSHLESFILTNQPPEAVSTAGRYRLTYKGEGDIKVGGLARRVRYLPGEIWFEFTPGEDPVGISIKSTDPNGTGNYIRDIAVVKESYIPLFEVGAVFNPHWIRRIRNLRAVRFMDWMFTNGSTISKWQQRPQLADYTYVSKGVPVEVMVALANEIGADPWFNMPHMADDGYNRQFAEYVRDNLEPKRKAYVEYSNEVWNYTFKQAQWALQQAEARWGREADGWMQFAGMRAAQMARVWREVFGDTAKNRLVRVVATHTDWPGLEEALLQAPLWQDEGGQAPVKEFDAYAVTGYFGLDLGSDEMAPQVLRWIKDSKKTAEKAAANLQDDARHSFVEAHQYDRASILAAKAIRHGSLAHIIDEALPYQGKVAAKYNLQLVMYEGGTHVVGLGDWAGNKTLGAFFSHFNYTPEMADIYGDLLQGWQDAGGTLFNAFVDVARTSQWGSWGALRHLDDNNPRWNVLAEFNQNTPAWWSQRPADTFAHGVTRWGTEDNDTLHGTPQADTLLGSNGDDQLISLGGADRLHGGDGLDQAVLLGSADQVEIVEEGALTLLVGPNGTVRLFSIETVSFSDEPGVIYSLTD